jgi:hypothetical protein
MNVPRLSAESIAAAFAAARPVQTKAAVLVPLGWALDRMARRKPKTALATALATALGVGAVGAAAAVHNHGVGRNK